VPDTTGEVAGPVGRALDLLRLVAESGVPLSLTQIAHGLELPTSTVHRMVGLLRGQGMLGQDPATKLYTPGEELIRIGMLVANRWDVDELARPALRALVDACDETVQLSRYLPQQQAMTIVAHVRCDQPLQFFLPLLKVQPLLWGSSGRVILAHLDDETVEKVVADAHPAPTSGQAVPPLPQIREELTRIRRQGWDRTPGEKLAGAVGYAAPVFDRTGVIGSVSVPIPAVRFDEADHDRFVGLVTECAGRISHQLGHSPAP
jgi:IclR family acetate operon transcriptional repressor